MPIFGFLPGASKQDIIDRELANQDLNERGTDFANRSGSWNWQDSFGAFLAGTNKAEVLAGAKAKRDQQLEDKYSGTSATNTASLGPLTAQYTGADGKTEKEIQAALAADTLRAKAVQQVIADGRIDPSELSTMATAGEIYGANTKAKREYDEQKQKDIDDKDDKRYDERMRLLYQDRADNRAAQNRQYELQIMQLQQADKLKAQERKDRMFMTLMAGLQNLGQGFTI